jgi:serine/threonine protein kinase
VDVAVKTLNEGSGEEDRVKFLQEAAIMGQFKHPNVVEMYGVVAEGEPVSLLSHFGKICKLRP